MYRKDNIARDQFHFFQIIFGFYLTIHFLELIPFAHVLFTDNGMIGNSKWQPTYGMFPNPLNLDVFNTIWGSSLFLVVLSVLSCMYLFGKYRRTVSFFLWFGWASLLNKNILISNPGIPYVGWLLMASILIPPVDSEELYWNIPIEIRFGSWWIMAVGYTVSGIDKLLTCESWRNGTALIYVLNGPLANDNWIVSFLTHGLPPICLRLLTWSALALEIFFLPLCLTKKTRQFAWWLMVCMHLGVMITIDFVDLTMGVLMIHLFTFDLDFYYYLRTDVKAKVQWQTLPEDSIECEHCYKNSYIVLYDGECGLCQNIRMLVRRYDWFDKLVFLNLHDDDSVLKVLGRLPNKTDLEEKMHLFMGWNLEQSPKVEFAAVHTICSVLPVAYPIYILLKIPFFYTITEKIYQWVSENRLIISKSFGWNQFCTEDKCVRRINKNR